MKHAGARGGTQPHAGGESAYATGAAIPMRHNDPPVISGSLGDLTATGLSYAYTVTE